LGPTGFAVHLRGDCFAKPDPRSGNRASCDQTGAVEMLTLAGRSRRAAGIHGGGGLSRWFRGSGLDFFEKKDAVLGSGTNI